MCYASSLTISASNGKTSLRISEFSGRGSMDLHDQKWERGEVPLRSNGHANIYRNFLRSYSVTHSSEGSTSDGMVSERILVYVDLRPKEK